MHIYPDVLKFASSCSHVLEYVSYKGDLNRSNPKSIITTKTHVRYLKTCSL